MTARPYKFREFNRLLKKNGYMEIRQTGDHKIYSKDGRIITVPYDTDINKYIAKSIIKEYQLIA